jgi:hypothetical protein
MCCDGRSCGIKGVTTNGKGDVAELEGVGFCAGAVLAILLGQRRKKKAMMARLVVARWQQVDVSGNLFLGTAVDSPCCRYSDIRCNIFQDVACRKTQLKKEQSCDSERSKWWHLQDGYLFP